MEKKEKVDVAGGERGLNGGKKTEGREINEEKNEEDKGGREELMRRVDVLEHRSVNNCYI